MRHNLENLNDKCETHGQEVVTGNFKNVHVSVSYRRKVFHTYLPRINRAPAAHAHIDHVQTCALLGNRGTFHVETKIALVVELFRVRARIMLNFRFTSDC